ncbi:unnamed protein product [Amoebophrya sp. A120]|nr:unnamed protein product [Amoebophrya sp. A120]|eukprot:GSA120T00004334001.1
MINLNFYKTRSRVHVPVSIYHVPARRHLDFENIFPFAGEILHPCSSCVHQNLNSADHCPPLSSSRQQHRGVIKKYKVQGEIKNVSTSTVVVVEKPKDFASATTPGFHLSILPCRSRFHAKTKLLFFITLITFGLATRQFHEKQNRIAKGKTQLFATRLLCLVLACLLAKQTSRSCKSCMPTTAMLARVCGCLKSGTFGTVLGFFSES